MTASARATLGIRGLAVSVLLLGILQQELKAVPPVGALILFLVALGFTSWYVRAEWRSPRDVALAGSLFVLTLLVTTAPFLVVPSLRSLNRLSTAATPTVAAWIFFLLVFARRSHSRADASHAGDHARAGNGPAWHLPALLAGTFVLMAGAHWWLRRDYVTFFDEPLYLLQSRLMREPGFSREIDASLSPFFVLRQTIYSAGKLYTQYPPGQPALLAAFDAVGLRWWTGVVASTVGVLFTYLLCRDLFSEFAGRVAAAILATNQYIVAYGTSYMPHGTGIALGAGAAWLVHRGTSRRGWSRAGFWSGAGLLLGCLVTIRPLTGAAITLSIVLWQLMTWKGRWQDIAGLGACLAAGCALPAVALMYYNDATNGSPLLFGYTAIHGSLHDLGFGQRGFVVPGADGQPTTELIDFTARQAVAKFLMVISELVGLLSPALLLVPPLILICARYRLPVRYAPVAAFVVLPAAHFFYFYLHSRFYIELFPFLFIGVAGLLDRLRRVDRSLATTFLVAILTGQLLLTGVAIPRRARERATPTSVIAHVRETQATLGKLLVFVEGDETLLNFVAWFNIDDFPGDVIVARDLGDRNGELIRRFADHKPMRLDRSRTLVDIARLP